MPTIDADCHVIESEHTWSYLAKADKRFKPKTVIDPDDNNLEYWVIDGKLKRVPFAINTGSSEETISGFSKTTASTRTLQDVTARLAHMDELGVDYQVLYPTVYLTQISGDPAEELALAKSYNRWLGDIWDQSEGRLRWVAVPPLMSMDALPDELRIAKDHGACGVFMRGYEGNRILVDSYFDPLYKAASELDMPVCVHAGCGNPAFADLTRTEAYARNKFPVLGAFHSFLSHGLPARFPDLRLGFVEVAASWVPYMLIDLERRLARQGTPLSDDPLGDNRMFVACQTNDDIPYVLDHVNENNLVIGSDYGHADTSSELEALRSFKQSGIVADHVVDKILWDNPSRLYSI